MGLSTNEDQGSVTFLSVVFGKFAQKADKDTTGADMRINKAGNEVWEVFHTDVEGQLVGITIDPAPEDNPEWGKKYQFTFQDNDGKYVVGLDADLAFMVIARLANLDLASPFNVHIFKGQKGTGVTVNQGGVRIANAHLDKAPRWEAMLDKKGAFVSWDKTESEEYFEKVLEGIKFLEFVPLVATGTEPSPQPDVLLNNEPDWLTD